MRLVSVPVLYRWENWGSRWKCPPQRVAGCTWMRGCLRSPQELRPYWVSSHTPRPLTLQPVEGPLLLPSLCPSCFPFWSSSFPVLNTGPRFIFLYHSTSLSSRHVWRDNIVSNTLTGVLSVLPIMTSKSVPVQLPAVFSALAWRSLNICGMMKEGRQAGQLITFIWRVKHKIETICPDILSRKCWKGERIVS